MYIRLNRARRTLPVVLGIGTLASVGLLFALDAVPELFPLRAHDYLAAFPLAMIAIAYLTYQAVRRTARAELVKALMLAMAFFLWSANQFWPNWKGASRLNDLAIALFVLDVFLVMIGWPANSPDESFAETLAIGEGGAHSALPVEDRVPGK